MKKALLGTTLALLVVLAVAGGYYWRNSVASGLADANSYLAEAKTNFDSGDIVVLQDDPTTLPLQCARSVRDGAPAGSGGPGFFRRPVANPREPLRDDRSDREPGLLP